MAASSCGCRHRSGKTNKGAVPLDGVQPSVVERLSIFNAINRGDPSRTTLLRRQFESNMYKRFRWLKGKVREAVVTNDVFGLKKHQPLKLAAELAPGAFAFATDAAKVTQFMDWLRELEAEGILESQNIGGTIYIDSSWKKFIRTAYHKGTLRGWQEAKRAKMLPAGTKAPNLKESGSLIPYFAAPIHVKALELLFTRSYNELRGITEAMNQSISRILAQGMAEGKSAMEIARSINLQVDNIGIVRARTLARTEVIRAHHSAMMGVYKDLRIENVYIMVEWTTAGSAVCPDCAALHGRIFTIEEIFGLIPLHPNCRCVAIPADVGESTRGEYEEESIGEEYFDKRGKPRYRSFYERKTGRKKLPPRDIVKAKRFFGNWGCFITNQKVRRG